MYKGALYENIVAEGLKKSGYELYYYKKNDSTLVEDFFIRSHDCLIPIEVKSGIKFAKTNIGYTNSIYTFPLFLVFLLYRYMHE